MLANHGITCSMSRRGNCYDNAVAESWFATLKSELGDHFESYGTAKAELFDYIETFYNRERLHSTLGYRSPEEYEHDHNTTSDDCMSETTDIFNQQEQAEAA